MERPDRIPFLGMFGKIAFGGPRPVCAHGGQPRQIRRLPQGFALGWLQPVEQGQKRHDRPVLAQTQKDPIAFLAPLHQTRFGQYADMA